MVIPPPLKSGIPGKEHCQVHMCTKFQVDILKNDWVLIFLRSETANFYAISYAIYFIPFFKFCLMWAIQNLFCSHFFACVLDEKMTKNMCHWSKQFSVWQFHYLITLIDLDLKYMFYWPISIWYGNSAWQDQISHVVK